MCCHLQLSLVLSLFSPALLLQAGVQESLIYVNELLAANKKVAIIMMDMQEGFFKWTFHQHTPVIDEQVKLVSSLSGKDNLYFIDVNYDPHVKGNTLPYMLQALQKNQHYKLITKNTDSAFESYKSVLLPSGQKVLKADNALSDYLKSEGISNLLVTGCFDGACIIDTVQSALEQGYDVAVDRELNIADHSPTQEENLFSKAWNKIEAENPKMHMITRQARIPCNP